MKAYVLKKHGGVGMLKITEVPEPEPQPGEVKVRLTHIGLNYAEVLSRRGQYNWAPKMPYIPGMEGVGEVVALGKEVSGHKIGDRVIVGAQHGMYAEYVCVPGYLAFPIPEGMSSEEAAALLVNYMTAWIALTKILRVEKSDTFLVHSAAGGVGTATLQFAHILCDKVIGTASSQEKLEIIEGYGARAINYTTEDFSSVIKQEYGGVDAVLEVIGGEVFKKSIRLLNPFGRLVVIGFASISLKKWNPLTWWKTYQDAPKVNVMNMAVNSYSVGASHIGYLTKNKEVVATEWIKMAEFISRNGIKPRVGKVFSFDQLGEAHAYMESRRSIGKIVVKLCS